MGYNTHQGSSIGDLPGGVVETLKGLGLYPVDQEEVDYESLPDSDSRFEEELQGSKHMKLEGLIDMAHKDGLALTYTEPVQIPKMEDADPRDAMEKRAEPVVFRAVVATRRGVFTAYGDATPEDTMVDAIIRMAETRALSRALRMAVNIGSATAPEMPGSGNGVQVE